MSDRTATRPVAVAAVGYLNARPLTEGLSTDPRFDAVFGSPAEASARVASGKADLGLLPIAEIARLGLVVVSDACVASFGAVDSVLLFLKTAPARVRRVGLDTASRTSRELAAWYLRSVGASFEVEDAEPRTAINDPRYDAVLSIGDDALELARGGAPRVDLSEAWAAREGTPFVFAAWGARPEIAARPRLSETLSAARDRGTAMIPKIAAAAAATPEDVPALIVYLSRRLRYVLGPAEERGLARFLTAAGLPPIRRARS